MNAELTAENRPACVAFESMTSAEYGNTQTHKDEGRVQVLIVLPGIVPVKFFRFFAVCSEEVVSRIVGPEGFKELLEGEMEADGLGCQCVRDYLAAAVDWIVDLMHLFGSI